MANNIAYAYQYFIGKGLSPEAAAGIVGNLRAESGVNPESNQVGGPGRGIAQWSEGGRWETLKAWAGGKNPEDLDTQLGFLWHELNTGYKHVLTELKSTNNVRHATAVFMKEFEIPADTSAAAVSGRVELAQGVTTFKQTGPGSGGGNGVGDFNEKEFMAALTAAGWSSFLLNEFPELKKIAKQAVNGKWTVERFIGAVKSSDFYQNRSDAMLAYDSQKENHNKEWKAQLEITKDNLRDQFAASGVEVDEKRLNKMAQATYRFGLDPAQQRDMIAAEFKYKPKALFGGEAGLAIDQVKQLAADYGISLSDKAVGKWTEQIIAGDADIQKFKEFAVSKAKRDYGWLSDEFDKGQSLAQIADPYVQSMAKVLELNPSEIGFDDKRIRKALQYDADGTGKNYGLAPQWHFEDELRKDPRWQVTKNARETYMDFGMKVLQDFGVMA